MVGQRYVIQLKTNQKGCQVIRASCDLLPRSSFILSAAMSKEDPEKLTIDVAKSVKVTNMLASPNRNRNINGSAFGSYLRNCRWHHSRELRKCCFLQRRRRTDVIFTSGWRCWFSWSAVGLRRRRQNKGFAVVSRMWVKYLPFSLERVFLNQFALWLICSVLFLLFYTRKN